MSSFTHSATTSADLETTWAALQHGETWSGLGGVSDVRNITHDGPDLRGFMFSAHVGGRGHPGAARVMRSERPRLMDLEISTREIEGSIVTSLSPVEEGTRVTVTLTARPRSMMVRLAFGVISAAIQNGLPRQVEEFADRIG